VVGDRLGGHLPPPAPVLAGSGRLRRLLAAADQPGYLGGSDRLAALVLDLDLPDG